MNNFKRAGMAPHSGFITKGDDNAGCDQTSIVTDSKGNPVEPVKLEWVKGKVEFNEEIDFILIIIVIVAISVMIVIIIIVLFRRRKNIQKEGEEEDDY